MSEKTVSIADAKAHLSELAERAAAGDAVVITRRGRPIARMSAAVEARAPVDLQRLQRLTEKLPSQSEDAATVTRRLREDTRY